jgi:hypothetical protein
MEIKHKITGAVLYSGEAQSSKKLLEQAVKEKADLRFADFRDAYLSDANLEGADLISAYLRFANLSDANLRGADLISASLIGAKIDFQIQEGLLLQIADIVTANPNCLNMEDWHTCETTHCLAGWACHLNPVAKELEKTHGTQIAGLLTLGAEAHSWFFLDNETVLENLQKLRSK